MINVAGDSSAGRCERPRNYRPWGTATFARPMSTHLYLLLGSNVGDREEWLRAGRQGIAQRIGEISKVSDIFETAAWGATGQAAFLNQAVRVRVAEDADPQAILSSIHAIEAEAGRERREKWEARTLDIDVLLLGEVEYAADNLRIPHPELPNRRFALTPLAQIAPHVHHPLYRSNVRTQTILDLLQVCADPLPVTIYKEVAASLPTRNYTAIEGVIGAGKTTLATRLAARSGTEPTLEEFSDNPFLPRFYADPERYALPAELHFLADRHRQLKRAMRMPGTGLTSDYTFHKCLLFAEVTLSAEDFRLFERIYALAEPQIPRPSRIIYLHADVPRLQARIRARGRSYEQSIPDDYLFRLTKAYERWLSTVDCPVIWVDTARVNYLGDPAVFEELASAWGSRPGIQRFRGW